MTEPSPGLPVMVRDVGDARRADQGPRVDLFQHRVDALAKAIAKAWLMHSVQAEQAGLALNDEKTPDDKPAG